MVTIVTQVRLPKGFIKEINKLVAKGFYTNKSDVIRDALRRFIIEKDIGNAQNMQLS